MWGSGYTNSLKLYFPRVGKFDKIDYQYTGSTHVSVQ